MNKIKQDILKSIIPRAVLLPLNQKTKMSISNDKFIPINNFPFKVGRESRISDDERGFFVKLRLRNVEYTPNNDIYLIDNNEFLQISKEHFEISIEDDSYIIVDRGSMNGTTLNNVTIGGDRTIEKRNIDDGDIVKIGTVNSNYEFQFLILDID